MSEYNGLTEEQMSIAVKKIANIRGGSSMDRRLSELGQFHTVYDDIEAEIIAVMEIIDVVNYVRKYHSK